MDILTQNYINELAQKIISIYNITIPIMDIERIVQQMGGKIEEKFNFDDICDGTIRKNGTNSFYIAVTPFQELERRTFTIARELGHLFLHMGFRINNQLWEQQSETVYRRFRLAEQEDQANEFATSLLMPKEIYKKILNENLSGNTVDISKIAYYFRVSVATVTKRGRILGYLI